MIDWLLSPLSGGNTHSPQAWAMWHARCMVLGWGVLLPLGVMAARFYKVTPRPRWPQALDNPAWWHAHRALQWAGIAVMRQTRFTSAAELEGTLTNYVKTYNHRIPQQALNHLSRVQALRKWQADKPNLFVKRVYNQPGLDSRHCH